MNMHTTRRRFCTTWAAAGASFAVGVARSQPAPWPSRPIRIIAPGVAGALFDLSARQIGERIAPSLGQPVIVDNRPGAGGIVGMQALARSAPDGYTFGVCTFAQLAVNPWMFEKPAYDPVGDFAPVTQLFESPIVIAVRADSPHRDWFSLLAAARSAPERLMYGSSGIGQPPHVLFELVQHRAGMRLLHVPYKGGPAAAQAVIGGDVQVVVEGAAGLVALVRAGRLRALACTGASRATALPDVPALAELGVAGIDNSWMALVAPAATPAPIVARMQREVAAVLAAPDLRAAYDASGRTPIGNAPDALAAIVRDSVPKWRELVRVAGLKAE